MRLWPCCPCERPCGRPCGRGSHVGALPTSTSACMAARSSTSSGSSMSTHNLLQLLLLDWPRESGVVVGQCDVAVWISSVIQRGHPNELLEHGLSHALVGRGSAHYAIAGRIEPCGEAPRMYNDSVDNVDSQLETRRLRKSKVYIGRCNIKSANQDPLNYPLTLSNSSHSESQVCEKSALGMMIGLEVRGSPTSQYHLNALQC